MTLRTKDNTGASVTITLAPSLLFPAGFKVDGFSPDEVLSFDRIAPNEVDIGVDGYVVVAHIPTLKKFSFSIFAQSDAKAAMDAIIEREDSTKQPYLLSGVISYPGLKEQVAFTDFAITGYPPAPGVKKKLDSLSYELTGGGMSVVQTI